MLFYARSRRAGVAGGGFTPVLVTYASGTAATETAPAGATNVVIEVWGGGGGGHKGDATPTQGYSGGSSGYSRTSLALGSSGLTLTYTVGAGGKGQDASLSADGTASTVSSGTATIATMTANGGGRSTGIAGGAGIAGAGGTATGGTAVNTTGSVGDQNGTNIPAPVGVNANLTGTSGAGGAGSANNATNASAGNGGLVAFYYT